ncbi:hypothetical protein [Microvirga terricola]
MSSTLWPWLTLAGLGAFHGLNPAMGWLFAVALGLHRQSRGVVFLALAPIALGHAAAVAVVLMAVVVFGAVLDMTLLARASGIVLVIWALAHALFGHRGRVRVGMQAGLVGLALWSFMMAGAHGAGLMLVPPLLTLCASSGPAAEVGANTSLPIALAALGVHTAAMLATIGVVSLIVYDRGLAFLRRSWINLDALWSGALAAGGLVLLAQ